MLLSQVHSNLTSLNKITLTTLAEHILLVYTIVLAHLLYDIVDGERMVIYLYSTLDNALSQLHIDIRIINDRISHQRVHHTLQVTNTTICSLSNKLDYISRNFQSVALTLCTQDVYTQLWVWFLKLSNQSAGKTCEQAVLNTLQVNRRTVAGQNNLFAHTEQMVENMEEGIECLWRVHPLLDIINNQQIDALIEVDEVVSCILTNRISELHLEQSCTYIEYALLWISLAALKSDGIDEVSLTTS